MCGWHQTRDWYPPVSMLGAHFAPSFTNGVVYLYQGCVREGLNSAGFAAWYANISRFAARRLTIPCCRTRASTPAPDLGPEMFLIPVEVGNTFLTN